MNSQMACHINKFLHFICRSTCRHFEFLQTLAHPEFLVVLGQRSDCVIQTRPRVVQMDLGKPSRIPGSPSELDSCACRSLDYSLATFQASLFLCLFKINVQVKIHLNNSSHSILASKHNTQSVIYMGLSVMFPAFSTSGFFQNGCSHVIVIVLLLGQFQDVYLQQFDL